MLCDCEIGVIALPALQCEYAACATLMTVRYLVTYHEIHHVDVSGCTASIVGAYVHRSVGAEHDPWGDSAVNACEILLDPEMQ